MAGRKVCLSCWTASTIGAALKEAPMHQDDEGRARYGGQAGYPRLDYVPNYETRRMDVHHYAAAGERGAFVTSFPTEDEALDYCIAQNDEALEQEPEETMTVAEWSDYFGALEEASRRADMDYYGTFERAL
jgi:hypothetical protein